MFGINNVDQVKQIVEGWTKDIVKSEQELHDKRMEICKVCVLFTAESKIGPKCDPKKCVDKNGEISRIKNSENICGCGCALHKKTRVKKAKCVLKKW